MIYGRICSCSVKGVVLLYGNDNFLWKQVRSNGITNTYQERRFDMDVLKAITMDQLRTDMPNIQIGDTVKVYVKVKEGAKERIQMYEGTVIKKKGGGIQETFTVRRLSSGIGVERTFPVNSPIIDKVVVVRHGKVRRAKLFYLRKRVGKAAKVKERLGD